MQVLITLNEPLGLDLLGPFQLTANIGTVTPSSATRVELINGIEVTVNNNATQISIISDINGNCSNSILNLNISNIPIIEEPETFNTYYLSAHRSILDEDNSDAGGCSDIYDYCVSPGYVTTTIVYAQTIDPTLSSLLNTTLYTNTLLTTPFVGLGTDIRYAVSTSDNLNTFISGPTEYRLIEINNIGYVTILEVNPCNCSDNGGGPIV